ncbi:hypothetical protein GJ496_001630 [Pomphorhynchus laevis]|nr:hypothetical protein GJ496_001630 [Pomphorhynchus laevis]
MEILRNSLVLANTKIDNLVKQVDSFRDTRSNEAEKSANEVARSVMTTSKIDKDTAFLEYIREQNRHNKRASNILIKGLPESENELMSVKELFDSVGRQDSPPWLIVNTDEITTNNLLSRAWKLKDNNKFSRVFVSAYLSLAKREAYRSLRVELRDKRTANPREHYELAELNSDPINDPFTVEEIRSALDAMVNNEAA